MVYAGDVSVAECWEALVSDKNAQLVDVRTVPEWQFVGIPDLRKCGKQTVLVEWQRYPDMRVNDGFVEDVENRLAKVGTNREDRLFLLCRSGVRSMDAARALTTHGYSNAFNVIGGFEGDKDANGHRATLDGWKHAGLPWVQ
ncbi:MAG: rhodanese-like domain-containing protein [Pseudomonadota bacterium]